MVSNIKKQHSCSWLSCCGPAVTADKPRTDPVSKVACLLLQLREACGFLADHTVRAYSLCFGGFSTGLHLLLLLVGAKKVLFLIEAFTEIKRSKTDG